MFVSYDHENTVLDSDIEKNLETIAAKYKKTVEDFEKNLLQNSL